MDTDLLTGRAAPSAALATENEPSDDPPSSYYRVPEGWYGREAAAWVEGVMAYRAGLTVRFTFPEVEDEVDQAIATRQAWLHHRPVVDEQGRARFHVRHLGRPGLMPLVRIHVSLFAGDPENHERSITFLQVSELLPDDVDLAEFAQGLQARVLIEQETDFRSGEQGNGPRVVVDLTPDRTPF